MVSENSQTVPEMNPQISNREWKSSAFTAYFGTKERAAELYQALEHEEISPEEVEFATLQGVIFMARKNDMAFTAGKKVLVIGEHQSTVNLNMALRDAIYYGRTMEKLVPPRDIYKTGRIQIPTPEFYVFYNGISSRPPEEFLRLSDLYIEKTDEPMLELIVKVININLSAEHPILQKSRSMYEYSWFVDKIRDYQNQGKSRDEAVKETMKDCMREGIMEDFIKEHGSEVENMLFTEFNMDIALEVRYEEGLEQGRSEGETKKLVQQICKKLRKGKTPEMIADELEEDEAEIQRICEISKEYAPEYDCEQICRQLCSENWQ